MEAADFAATLFHQVVGEEAALLQTASQRRMRFGQLGVVHDVADERQGEDGLDAAGQPAMMEMVPVGAMVVRVALRTRLPFAAHVLSGQLGNVPRSAARSSEALTASSWTNPMTSWPS